MNFNLIRLFALISMLKWGWGVELRWQAPPAGKYVTELFMTYGVPSYDQKVYFKEHQLSCRVPAKRAKFAQYLLLRAGVPVITPRLPGNEKVEPGPLPKRTWKRPARPEGFIGLLATLMGVKPWEGENELLVSKAKHKSPTKRAKPALRS